MSGSIVYRVGGRGIHSSPEGNALAQARLSEPESPHQQIPPVRFNNPFDASEVLEFPPGTSDAEARESVANLLIERARDRQTRWPHARKSGAKTTTAG